MKNKVTFQKVNALKIVLRTIVYNQIKLRLYK